MPTAEISPVKQRGNKKENTDLHTIEVKTWLERRFQEELVVKDAEIKHLKGYILQLQSQMVLQRVYCAQVRRQLKAKEKKAEKKGKQGGRILGDGQGRLLTGSVVFKLVDEHEAAKDAEAAEKEARQQRKLDYDAEVAEWAEQEERRVKRNQEGSVRWAAAVEAWKERKKQAKAEGIKDWEKENRIPKKTDPEFFQKATQKPKMKKAIELEQELKQEGNWTDSDDESNSGDEDN
ncbi:hypothetical protein GALMADRAFT_207931 [Galerina marginata CBS 339.88]|uniref:Uncharacterized protein n=1 Tax=Galerina marginata (strain CBS 339.88) TaxID=685588 RepID=A0A067TCY1_GALM3|nr:hypothetical protein GALMADRAFT_207931 [Galerina marginata CBS 339.88]